MKFIRPVSIGDAQFVSSTVAETDHAAWSGATTYALGARCISTTSHRIYESVQAGNLNHNPLTDSGLWWLDVGPTNRWAMLDRSVGTSTTGTALIAVTLAPGAVIDSLALLDVTGALEARIVMTDGATTVYDQTASMHDTAPLASWYDYFFEPFSGRSALVVSDLPAYSAGEITVTVTGDTSISIGTLALGSNIDVGKTQYGVRVGIIDYSRKETDEFGVTSVVERVYAKKIEAACIVDNNRIDYVAAQLANIRATPCVWVAGNDSASYESLLAYGFIKDWSLNIAYPKHSEFNLTIEGLT